MRALIFLLVLNITLFASTYSIKYKGIVLGKIKDLSTINQGYLKAKVTNPIVKLLVRKKYYVFYEDKKPNIKDAKFKHDNKKIIYALKMAIEKRPKKEEFIIDQRRKIILKCEDDFCTFDYFSKGQHSASGIIEFKNNEFYKLYEKRSTLEIIKDK